MDHRNPIQIAARDGSFRLKGGPSVVVCLNSVVAAAAGFNGWLNPRRELHQRSNVEFGSLSWKQVETSTN